MKLKVQDNHFFCQNSKNVLMRRVVDNSIRHQNILQQLHNKNGHKEEKVPINGLQTGISRITYMRRLRHMYSHIKNVNGAIHLDLKKHYI